MVNIKIGKGKRKTSCLLFLILTFFLIVVGCQGGKLKQETELSEEKELEKEGKEVEESIAEINSLEEDLNISELEEIEDVLKEIDG